MGRVEQAGGDPSWGAGGACEPCGEPQVRTLTASVEESHRATRLQRGPQIPPLHPGGLSSTFPSLGRLDSFTWKV